MKLHFLTFTSPPPAVRFRERIIYSYLVRQRRYDVEPSVGDIHKAFGFKHDAIRRSLVNLHRAGLVQVERGLVAVQPAPGVVAYRKDDGDWWTRFAFVPVQVRDSGRTVKQDVIAATLASLRRKELKRSSRWVARQVGVSDRTVRRFLDGVETAARPDKIGQPLTTTTTETNTDETESFEQWDQRTGRHTCPHANESFRRRVYESERRQGLLWPARLSSRGLPGGTADGATAATRINP